MSSISAGSRKERGRAGEREREQERESERERERILPTHQFESELFGFD